jgi:hypothetical protein
VQGRTHRAQSAVASRSSPAVSPPGSLWLSQSLEFQHTNSLRCIAFSRLRNLCAATVAAGFDASTCFRSMFSTHLRHVRSNSGQVLDGWMAEWCPEVLLGATADGATCLPGLVVLSTDSTVQPLCIPDGEATSQRPTLCAAPSST